MPRIASSASSKGFRNLVVWKRMQELVVLVYRLTEDFPPSEEFGLKSQMRRGAVSVLSNFVEGYLKRSKREKMMYLERSETALIELEAQAEICLLLNYFSDSDYEQFDKKRAEVGYLLHRYKTKVGN